MSHTACGHLSAWTLTVFPGSELNWTIRSLEFFLLLKYTHSIICATALPALHLPRLSISPPFVFKEHLSGSLVCLDTFFQQRNPHHYPKGRLTNSELDMIKNVYFVCPQTPGKLMLKSSGKQISHY